jgi:hypothetical protein
MTKRQSWLLAVTLAPWNYPLSFVADTTLALSLLSWSVFRIERPGAAVLVVLCGVISWTLLEYVSHRFVFHGSKSPRSFREGHGKHHGAPRDRLALPFFVPPLVAVVFVSVSCAVLGASLGVLFSGVNAAGYLAYAPCTTWCTPTCNCRRCHGSAPCTRSTISGRTVTTG